VTRVVSPGTLIDEKFIDQFASNFIISISAESASAGSKGKEKRSYGLAWLDIGTADFHSMFCSDAQSLRDQVARISPKEAILQPGVFGQLASDEQEQQVTTSGASIDRWHHPLWEALPEGGCMVTFAPEGEEHAAPASPFTEGDSTGPILTSAEEQAVAQLTRYIELRLLELTSQDTASPVKSGFFPLTPKRMIEQECMQIDAHTIAALEIRNANREGGVRGSLISAARRTMTRGGARLLEEWLSECTIDVDRCEVPILIAHFITTSLSKQLPPSHSRTSESGALFARQSVSP
jgi:DNA mismatch repair ATPase MutS